MQVAIQPTSSAVSWAHMHFPIFECRRVRRASDYLIYIFLFQPQNTTACFGVQRIFQEKENQAEMVQSEPTAFAPMLKLCVCVFACNSLTTRSTYNAVHIFLCLNLERNVRSMGVCVSIHHVMFRVSTEKLTKYLNMWVWFGLHMSISTTASNEIILKNDIFIGPLARVRCLPLARLIRPNKFRRMKKSTKINRNRTATGIKENEQKWNHQAKREENGTCCALPKKWWER